MQDKNSQKGRSMIEMIAVLAIIGIITVGAIAGINQGFVKYRTSKTFTEIRAINQGVANMYAYKRAYTCYGEGTTNLNLQEACDSRVFPSGCEKTGDDYTGAVNPFGGNYTVTFVDKEKDFNKCYAMKIEADRVPAAACQELMNLEWGKYLRRDEEGSTNIDCNPNGADFQTFSITMD